MAALRSLPLSPEAATERAWGGWDIAEDPADVIAYRLGFKIQKRRIQILTNGIDLWKLLVSSMGAILDFQAGAH